MYGTETHKMRSTEHHFYQSTITVILFEKKGLEGFKSLMIKETTLFHALSGLKRRRV